MSSLNNEMEDDSFVEASSSSTTSSRLPWDGYNDHFKVLKILKDEIIYQTFEVKCTHCPSTKTRTADTWSKTNLHNHLKV